MSILWCMAGLILFIALFTGIIAALVVAAIIVWSLVCTFSEQVFGVNLRKNK